MSSHVLAVLSYPGSVSEVETSHLSFKGHNITRITHSRNIYFNANVKMFFCKLYKKYIYFLFFIRYVSEVSN